MTVVKLPLRLRISRGKPRNPNYNARGDLWVLAVLPDSCRSAPSGGVVSDDYIFSGSAVSIPSLPQSSESLISEITVACTKGSVLAVPARVVKCRMSLAADTGASVSVMSESLFKASKMNFRDSKWVSSFLTLPSLLLKDLL